MPAPADRPLTRHDLYEICVQSPAHLVPLLRAIPETPPRVLGEDFSGTAALSIAWAEHAAEHSAVAADLDAEALAHHPDHPRVKKVCADVMDVRDPCDVLFVGNFSIGYWHTRADLLRYLRHAHARLARSASPRSPSDLRSAPLPSAIPAAGGVFVCDTYGGESAFVRGAVHRDHWLTGEHVLQGHRGKRVRYTWEQRDADPLTGMVTDVLHFRVIDVDQTITEEFDDAFVYRWRLWSVPELRDAMLEAGFARTEVFAKVADAVDTEGNAYITPVRDPAEELEDSFIVLVAAYTA